MNVLGICCKICSLVSSVVRSVGIAWSLLVIFAFFLIPAQDLSGQCAVGVKEGFKYSFSTLHGDPSSC